MPAAVRWSVAAVVEAQDWCHVGGEDDAPLLLLPTPHPQLPGTRLVEYFVESPSAYPGIRDWLEQRWVQQRMDVWFYLRSESSTP